MANYMFSDSVDPGASFGYLRILMRPLVKNRDLKGSQGQLFWVLLTWGNGPSGLMVDPTYDKAMFSDSVDPGASFGYLRFLLRIKMSKILI